MLKTAVVILNWNTRNFLEKFLPPLLKNTTIPNTGLFVADNGSTDGSAEYVIENFPDIGLIRLDDNYGFANGYNKALSEIEAEYFVLLNSDVEVTQGWLDPLVEMMNSNPLIAACMPKIKSYDMPDFFEYAGASGGFIDKNGYPFCQGRIFDSIETDYGQYDIAREIFWASGACFMIRAKLYALAGGLDAHFFAHFEEIDLCWRLKNRGYKIMVVPTSVVYHVGGGTLQKSNSLKTYLNFRNSLLTLYKNLPENKLITTISMRIFLDMVSGFRLLLQFKATEFFAILKAHFSFWTEKRSFRKFRNEELKFINRMEHKEIYNGNIVFDYFFRKKITFKSLEWNLQEMNKNKK